MMPYVSGQIKFGYKIKVTVTKKLKNMKKKFAKYSNMHNFELYLCHRIVYVITVILIEISITLNILVDRDRFTTLPYKMVALTTECDTKNNFFEDSGKRFSTLEILRTDHLQIGPF